MLVSLQGFLGVARIVATTDTITALPRQMGTTLAPGGALRLVDCPVRIQGHVVSQHWHTRFRRDPGNRRLRVISASEAVW